MDVTYVAIPMVAGAFMTSATSVVKVFVPAIKAESLVAAYARPLSIGGTSLSAVSPDHISRKELALAGA